MKRLFLCLATAAMLVLGIMSVQAVRQRDKGTPAAASAVSQGKAVAVSAADAAPLVNAHPSANAVHIKFVKNPKAAPDFSVTTFDGQTMSAASLRGKVVIVNFWATWCGPCRAEIPALIALQKKYADDLVILGLSADETGDAGVRKFAADHQMSYPVAMSTNNVDSAFGGVVALPTSFIVNRAGAIVQKHVGLIDPQIYENEVRALAHLPIDAVIEEFEDKGEINLENAAEANSIPGIDLSALTPDQKLAALKQMNAEHCTCGCNNTLAQCRINDPSCATSLPLAKKIVDAIGKKGGGA